MPRKQKGIAIIYHSNCPDGFGAAYAAWKKFGSRADYYPLAYSDKTPAIRGKKVYLLDFMFDHDAPLKVLQKANVQVTAIDHHVSNKMRTMSTTDYRYALHNSGAVLAWQYFHPGKQTPWLLRYVEDRDIWAMKLPSTREISSWLGLAQYDFKIWDKLVRNLEKAKFRQKAVQEGALLRRYETKLTEDLVNRKAVPVRFAGHGVYAINSTLFADELGHILYKKYPPFAIIWNSDGQDIKVSLRGNGSIDLTKFAQKYGGGGHHDACGFSVKASQGVPWKPMK
jgi:oligoribonuclease NrnB/cAMP/cGMP phosphodiesterase (DHH superfamily)